MSDHRIIPVCERPLRGSQYLVTARAEPSAQDRLILLDGSRLIEEVRTARAQGGETTQAILATRSRHGGVARRALDISWLRAASETYKVSANIKDYVFVSIPIVTADIPNRNMDCFSFGELTHFSPIHGRVTFQTFIGKACHQNHQNQDPTKAKGVHFDSTMRQYDVRPAHVGYDSNTKSIPLWKVRVLTGWDRTKDESLVKSILRRERNAYSMGALIDYAMCSVPSCGKVTTPKPCEHIAGGKGRISRDNYVCFDYVCGANFFETSCLDEEPADPDAFSPDGVLSAQNVPAVTGSVSKKKGKSSLWITGLEV